MQMDNAPSFLLQAKGRREGGNLKDTALVVPYGPDTPSGGVVVGIDSGASKPSVAFSQFSFDALKLGRVAAEFLQQEPWLSCEQKPANMIQERISSCIPG